MNLLTKDEIHAIVFNTFGMNRFLQDSPIRPDVWERYLTLAARGDGKAKVSLILTPKQARSEVGLRVGRATELSMLLAGRLGRTLSDESKSKFPVEQAPSKAQEEYRIAATSRYVAIDVSFEELMLHLLPHTGWWKALSFDLRSPEKLQKLIERALMVKKPIKQALMDLNNTEFFRFFALASLTMYLLTFSASNKGNERDGTLEKLILALAPDVKMEADDADDPDDVEQRTKDRRLAPSLQDLGPLWEYYFSLASRITAIDERDWTRAHNAATADHSKFGLGAAALNSDTAIWAIQRNRRATRQSSPVDGMQQWMKPLFAPELSRDTVKADAALRLFSISTSSLVWAVVDTGIDALHPAFCNKTVDGNSLINAEGEPVLDWDGLALRTPGTSPASQGWLYEGRNLTQLGEQWWLSQNDKRLVHRDGNWLVAYERRAGQIEPERTAFLRSRVTATLDFTILRKIVDGRMGVKELLDRVPWSQMRLPKIANEDELKAVRKHYLKTTVEAIRRHNITGREIDWSLIEPIIRLDPYAPSSRPTDPHGTHVTGILAGDLPKGVKDGDRPFFGICPDIQLYDLRVFSDDEKDGGGDEFTILAALDYIAWVNRDPERPGIHGVNLSLAIRHIVDAHACGGTPICDAANRMVWAGTVVVAAAGNFGFDQRSSKISLGIGYRGMSIADPGNAEQVITVGATHRSEPHTYGVSYFSSRGPTGDGRQKPDLVAPGEKIRSTIPGQQMLVMDGTSMAAPHVSGVCALLMARHSELIGEPERIKAILMDTATDLGREHYFQGKGLVDALRALQSI